MSQVLVDTNTLMDSLEIFENLNEEIIIHSIVLEEIDNIIHNSLSDEKKYKARQARNAIKKAINKTYSVHSPVFNLPLGWDCNKNDNKLIAVCKDLRYILYTNDLAMQVKAESVGVEFSEYGEVKIETPYNGIREINMTQQEYIDLMEILNKDQYNLSVNEYLIIHNTDNQEEYLLMWNGEYFEDVKIKPISNKYINKLVPLDTYQKAFIHMLQKDDTKIKITDSIFGAGKSFLMFHWALSMLDKTKYDRLLFVKSDSAPKHRKEYPTLPGDIVNKSEGLGGVLCDMTSENKLEDVIYRNPKIEMLPIQFAKGRSLENTILYINEAQDITGSEMKRLLSRIGANSIVLLDGSSTQIDNKYCFCRNGLTVASNNFRNEEIASQVNLITDFRSDLSKLVGQMDWSD